MGSVARRPLIRGISVGNVRWAPHWMLVSLGYSITPVDGGWGAMIAPRSLQVISLKMDWRLPRCMFLISVSHFLLIY